MNEMILHTFGDSHCGCRGWESIDIDNLKIITHYIGPITCSSFGLNKEKLLKVNNVKSGEIVCFVLGEIDCRIHIPRYKSEYKSIIDEIVEHYFTAIKVNADTIDDLIILVSSITPVPKDNTYITGGEWLPVGEDIERKVYVEYMNQKIKEKCKEYNYIYFDIYSQYCNNEGFLNPIFSDGAIHIHDGKYMKEELSKIIKYD